MQRSLFLLAASATLLLAACRDGDVVAYRVPKDSAASPAAIATAPPTASPDAQVDSGGGKAGTTVATANGAGLAWTAPAAWRRVEGSAMRKATFAIGPADAPTAELAVTAFPGEVGGEAANVNRWRGQINLPPAGDFEISASLTRLEVNGLKMAVADLGGGESSVRMLGAIVPFGNATWFFKLLGPDAVVAAERPAFFEFLATVRPEATPATP